MSDGSPIRLLVVCHANVARSVAAARLLGAAAAKRGALVDIRTAGTHATDGQAVSMQTRSALGELVGGELGLESHRSRGVDDDDVAWADLVVAMEASQVRWLRRRHPEASARTATMGLLARELPVGPESLAERIAAMGLGEHEPDDLDDVPDPVGDVDAYRSTIRSLALQCEALVARLVD